MNKRILFTGGPGTAKTTVINKLINKGRFCFEESSREIINDFKKKGIDQLFLSNPIRFSELLLKSRIQQFIEADKINNKCVFFDRGIPDIIAYLNFKNTNYSNEFVAASNDYRYDKVFIFKPWKEIYMNDYERYESYEELVSINNHIEDCYLNLGYNLIEVPFDSAINRMKYILKQIES